MKIKTAQKRFTLNVIYKTTNNGWRAFCFPFDISCEAKTKEEAYRIIRNLSALYNEGLKKYNYPDHLIFKKLSNSEDRRMLEIVRKELIKERQRMAEKDLFETKVNTRIEVSKSNFSGFYQQELSYC